MHCRCSETASAVEHDKWSGPDIALVFLTKCYKSLSPIYSCTHTAVHFIPLIPFKQSHTHAHRNKCVGCGSVSLPGAGGYAGGRSCQHSGGAGKPTWPLEPQQPYGTLCFHRPWPSAHSKLCWMISFADWQQKTPEKVLPKLSLVLYTISESAFKARKGYKNQTKET